MKNRFQKLWIAALCLLLFCSSLACLHLQPAPQPSISSLPELWTAPPAAPTVSATVHPDPTAFSIVEAASPSVEPSAAEEQAADLPDENGVYTERDDVALYLFTYGHLPHNFITKQEARALGWSGGNLSPYAPGKCIGGDRFGNYEGLLPAKKGRVYYECDIDTLDARSRGKKRIVYSNDGLIYYTDDHYDSFTLLYGGD